MFRWFTAGCMLALVLIAPCSDVTLPRSTPEAQGIPSSAVQAFVEAVNRDIDSVHSFMLVRHGTVVASGWWSPFDSTTPHMLYSLSKSFTSTAISLAIAEGKLSLDDRVIDAFPDEAPKEPSRNLKAMRLRDVLRMATGHQEDPLIWKHPSWVRAFFVPEVPHKPGTHFLYNSSATFMASAMLQRATGQTVFDYLKPRLFAPLSMQAPSWFSGPEGISAGAFGLMATTEDIAKFGQLYLQKGQWQGQQIVPADWVTAATSLQIANGSDPERDWDQGYGYQFWRCRHNAYRADGAFGQYCVVMPDQDAVMAITGGQRNMQATLNLVWQHVLPAMGSEALPENTEAQHKLTSLLAGLVMRMPAGETTSSLAKTISGKWYTLTEKDRGLSAVMVDIDSQPPAFVVRTAKGDVRTPFAFGAWSTPTVGFTHGADKFLSVPAHPLVSASAAWTAPDTLTIILALTQTPFKTTINLHFKDEEVAMRGTHHVWFGDGTIPELVGKLTE